jgi:hypothetical protein
MIARIWSGAVRNEDAEAMLLGERRSQWVGSS